MYSTFSLKGKFQRGDFVPTLFALSKHFTSHGGKVFRNFPSGLEFNCKPKQ